jgi:hypothetical protein
MREKIKKRVNEKERSSSLASIRENVRWRECNVNGFVDPNYSNVTDGLNCPVTVETKNLS